MKLKVVTVDLELSRTHRRIASGASAALLIATAGVAFGGVPVTFMPNTTLKSADLNTNFSNLDGRLATIEAKPAVPTLTDWVGYTPTLTIGPAGTPVTLTATGTSKTGQWRRVGDTLEVSIGGNFSCAGATTLYWSLPPGVSVDLTKLPDGNAQIGVAVVVGAAGITTGNVLAQGTTKGVAIQSGSAAVSCSTEGGLTNVRLSFAVPIQGWTFNN